MTATITLDQVKEKLVPLETIQNQLAKTEPLSSTHISGSTGVKFHFEPDWATGFDAADDTEVMPVTMSFEGGERQMTKEAVVQAGANHGLLAPYLKSLPAHLTEKLFAYHYNGGMGQKAYNVLSVSDVVSAFTRPTLVPFSNLQLLESTVAGIQQKLGKDVPIFADYKWHNSLVKTDVRLILPHSTRTMEDTNMDDVPDHGQDVWFKGIHLSNSLIGKTQTGLEGYMFRYWCTNGATTELEGVGAWNRKVSGQNDDVYAWMQEQVDEVLGGLEYRFDQVQGLSRLNVAGNVTDILKQIFEDYAVPVSQREAIQLRLLEVENLTMYAIMQAITQAANEADLEDKRRDRLMRIGGALPTEHFDTLKAQVWREGNSSKKGTPNPYEIKVMA